MSNSSFERLALLNSKSVNMGFSITAILPSENLSWLSINYFCWPLSLSGNTYGFMIRIRGLIFFSYSAILISPDILVEKSTSSPTNQVMPNIFLLNNIFIMTKLSLLDAFFCKWVIALSYCYFRLWRSFWSSFGW